MNKLTRKFLKLISANHINLKKNYKRYRKIITFFSPHIVPIYKMLDHKIYAKGREIPVRLFIPQESLSSKVIIFIHGGGWVTGNIDSYSNVCAHMANSTGHRVISVDYRLAPEYTFPEGLMDCYTVVSEIFKDPSILNCKREDICLVGDSAGGNLVSAVSLMARDRGDFIPRKQILIYPATFYDHTESSPYPSVVENGSDYIMTSKRIQDYMDLYVPNEEDRTNPYVAPLLSKNFKDQPDTLIITAEFDPLRDEGEAYGRALDKEGNYVEIHRIPDEIHGFFSNPLRRDTVNDIYDNLINTFLSKS